ncbi:MAG: hypothetical protein ACREUU_04040 [Gammaproteobacteria bacterium]
MVGVSRQSVYRWYKIHQSGGSLKTAHRSGRPPRLSGEALGQLARMGIALPLGERLEFG